MDSSKDSNVSVLRNEFSFIIVGILELGKVTQATLEYDKTWLIVEVDFRAHCQLSVITNHECVGI